MGSALFNIAKWLFLFNPSLFFRSTVFWLLKNLMLFFLCFIFFQLSYCHRNCVSISVKMNSLCLISIITFFIYLLDVKKFSFKYFRVYHKFLINFLIMLQIWSCLRCFNKLLAITMAWHNRSLFFGVTIVILFTIIRRFFVFLPAKIRLTFFLGHINCFTCRRCKFWTFNFLLNRL